MAFIVYRDVPADGRIHETDVEDDSRGRGDGRIKLFADGAGGIVCNWKGETRPFFADDGRKLSEAERRERARKRQSSVRATKNRCDLPKPPRKLRRSGRRRHRQMRIIPTYRANSLRQAERVIDAEPALPALPTEPARLPKS